ncbi:hypothetical protein A3Q56_04943 [Intoshia linei]|uniref:AMP-dependent synthetase/ligase domain-containing protein n=1 Tax=Intoshia linei TaxID=1819745 RepID=A0A177AZ80_9BILA|nr:hypothetical protein A3Q56_04943 [Intoshia linei]
MKDEKVHQAIEKALEIVNSKATNNVYKIKKWKILKKDFSIPGGEMGPTMKIKKKQVILKFKTEIDEIYKDKCML